MRKKSSIQSDTTEKCSEENQDFTASIIYQLLHPESNIVLGRVEQAVYETIEKCQLALHLITANQEIRIRGKGPDVSLEQKVFEDIVESAVQIAIIRISGIFYESKNKNNSKTKDDFVNLKIDLPPDEKEKFAKLAKLDSKESWTLEYFVRHLLEILSLEERQKEALREILGEIWDITDKEEFKLLMKLRNKRFAHLGRDARFHFDLFGDQKSFENSIKFYIMKALEIFGRIIFALTGLSEHAHRMLDCLKPIERETLIGLTPLIEIYKESTKETEILSKFTEMETISSTIQGRTMPLVYEIKWVAKCGCQYTARPDCTKDKYNRKWHLIRNSILLDDTQKDREIGIFNSSYHAYFAAENDSIESHYKYHLQ